MRKMFLVLGVMLLLLGCQTTPPAPPPSFNVSVESEKNTGLASIILNPHWQNSSLFSNSGISGFSMTVSNNTEKIIRVVWEKSSLSYNGGSYTPFINGQKYINATEPMAASVAL